MKHLTLLTLFLISAQTTAEDILVVPDQYPTIQEAINASSDGDEIFVQSGTYNESLFIDAKLIRIVGLGGASGTILDGSATPGEYVVRWQNANGSTVGLDGFTIRGASGGIITDEANPTLSNLVVDVSGGYGVRLAGNSEIAISNCVIETESGQGLRAAQPLNAQFSKFKGNTSCAYIDTSNGVVTTFNECEFLDSPTGIEFRNANIQIFKSSIRNCEKGVFRSNSSNEGFVSIDQTEIEDCGFGLYLINGFNNSSNGLIMTNSVIKGCLNGGVYIRSTWNVDITNSEIRFNSAQGGAGGAIDHEGGASDYVSVASTIVCGNTEPQIRGPWTNGGSNVIEQACQPIGACCFGGTCRVLSVPACEFAGGTFAGVDTQCVSAGCEPCETDLDNDGSVGLTDLIRLLSNWGPCSG